MGTQRLEAFSDGVLAIIITIMVLEMKIPHGDDVEALKTVWPVLLSYILSFVNVGIYWNNHHHLFHVSKKINASVMWANIHLLFWLSLMPFATGWMGENHFTNLPVALFGGVLLMSGMAYYILSQTIIHLHGRKSQIAQAIGKDVKGIISVVIYASAIPLAFVNTSISLALYVLVAAMWLVPDRRIEKKIINEEEKKDA